MFWAGTKVSDHGRESLSETYERIGSDTRMANGTLRRQHVAKKRTWTTSWNNLPSTNTVTGGMKTADGGMSGEQMEDFYNATNGSFRLVLRRGSAVDKTAPNPAETALPYEDNDFYICNVMMTEFSKEVLKRGRVDLWNVSVTLEEV